MSKMKIWFSTLATTKHSKLNITTALGDPLFGNYGGKGTGMVGGQTVRSMRCVVNQPKFVYRRNYALEAISGAGNDIIACETSEIQHCDSSGGAIIRKLCWKRDRGGGWADCSVHAVPC